MKGECLCRRLLLSRELTRASNISQCSRLTETSLDTRGLRYHASVPLWIGGRAAGVMNLAGPEEGLFDEEMLRMLDGVGNQVAVALERAELHEGLERLVTERTARLRAEVEERKRIQEEQARLVAILDATPDLVATASPDGRLLYCNQAGRRLLGLPHGDLDAFGITDGFTAWARRVLEEEGVPQAVERGLWCGETALRGNDGREIPVSQIIIAHRNAAGSVEYLSTIAHDITRRKQQEARIMRLNRIHTLVSGINTTIVRVRDRDALFREACRIAVEHGKFALAWLGIHDPDRRRLVPAAWAGREDGYVEKIDLTVPADAGEVTPPTLALIHARPAVCNRITPDDGGWAEEALQRGYRSVAVLPLFESGRVIGIFALYADEAGVFDEEELTVLSEVADDISFALDHLKKEETINYLAYFDEITGLPNRALFEDRLQQWIGASRKENKTFSVIILDLERFSIINETLGRRRGDELLRQVARRLQERLDTTDLLARLTADHFGIGIRRGEGANLAHILEGILSDIRNQPFPVDGEELRIAARAGVATFPGDGEDGESLHRNAEAALKSAKLAGEEFRFYLAEMNARVAAKLSLENRLRRALEQQQLVLYYQPKVDFVTRRICGLEALMRWQDPDEGLIPPVMFIPVLEETGLILEAGRWALVQAMTDYRMWREIGLNPPRIAVNVSPIQLRHPDFVAMVEAVQTGVEDAAALELEITESLIMQDIESNIAKLKEVQALGVEVAIDDFGTGYSSLSYIAKLPVNALKIDRAFIVNVAENPDDLAIVSSIISLAHSLNLRVVAEGVETEQQANLLRLLKCNEFQGYLFCPPVPAERIEELLRKA